jgi:hypothetical protein
VDILVFTDAKDLQKKMRLRGFLSLPVSDLKKTLARYREPVLVYLDMSSLGTSWEKTVSSVAKKDNVFLGVLDPKSRVLNVMDLVHIGVIDYIAHKEISKEPNEKRIKKIISYLKEYRLDFAKSVSEERKSALKSVDYIPVFHGWQDIKTGKEYTFSIMFVELDEKEEMEKRYGKSNLENALAVFQKYIERNATAFGGRLWMWSRFGGIILFPFNTNEFNSVLCGFRMIMYKYMHDVEESHFPNFISFRIALHLGNIIYQEINKGEVISDSINSVFHLGQRFAEPGNFYLTEEIFQYTQDPIKPYFKQSGTFEGRTILRMRLPVL